MSAGNVLGAKESAEHSPQPVALATDGDANVSRSSSGSRQCPLAPEPSRGR